MVPRIKHICLISVLFILYFILCSGLRPSHDSRSSEQFRESYIMNNPENIYFMNSYYNKIEIIT